MPTIDRFKHTDDHILSEIHILFIKFWKGCNILVLFADYMEDETIKRAVWLNEKLVEFD